MEVLEAIYRRRAIRSFTSEPVDRELIESLIDAAVHAPNAMDKQRWAFVVVRDRTLLARISAEAKALTLHVMGSARVDPGLEQFRKVLSAPEFNIFYDAPLLIVICGTEDDRFVDQDCCLAAQNLMLAAYAKGLGSCWIGFAEAWLNRPEAKKELGISATLRPIAPIILGYPQDHPVPPPRHRPNITWIEP
jgi:nitroreductase